MGLAGCGKFVKFSMVLANILIFIGGIAVLGVGIWTAVDKTTFVDVVGNDLYLSAAYIMIVTGSIVAIISFLGCAGAWMENKCLLVTYFIILLLIFVVLLVAGILGYIYKGEITVEVRKQMYETIEKKFENKPKLRDVYDKMQIELKCCGMTKTDKGEAENNANAYKVWDGNTLSATDKVPASCCNMDRKKEDINLNNCKSSPGAHVYKKDCFNAVKDAAVKHAMVVGGVGVGIACVLLLGMIFSLILCMTIQ